MNKEIQFNSSEMRLIILSRLYKKHYQGESLIYQSTENIFLDLIKQQHNILQGDLTYLKQKNMIDGNYNFGSVLLADARINANGIDKYESAMQQAYKKLKESDEKIPDDIKEDIKNNMMYKIEELLEKYSSIIRIFSKFFSIALNGN